MYAQFLKELFVIRYQLRYPLRATKCVENNLLYMPYITMLGKAVHYFQILS